MAPFSRETLTTQGSNLGLSVEHGNRSVARQLKMNELMVPKSWKQQADLRQVQKTNRAAEGTKRHDKLKQWGC